MQMEFPPSPPGDRAVGVRLQLFLNFMRVEPHSLWLSSRYYTTRPQRSGDDIKGDKGLQESGLGCSHDNNTPLRGCCANQTRQYFGI